MARVGIPGAILLTVLVVLAYRADDPSFGRVARQAPHVADTGRQRARMTTLRSLAPVPPARRETSPVWAFWVRVVKSDEPGRVALDHLNDADEEVAARAIFVLRSEWPSGSRRALLRLVSSSRSNRCLFFAAQALLARARLDDRLRCDLETLCANLLGRGFRRARG